MNLKGRNFNKTHHQNHHNDEDNEQKPQDEYSNRSLFLNRIPAKANNLLRLIVHFKRFGHIDAIYTSGTHTSIIFESEEATKAALESPVTVLHNRFINVSLQKPTVPNVANLESACNMDVVRNAVQAFYDDSKKEAEETEEIRANLKKKADLRKIEKANMIKENYIKEREKLAEEMQEIVNHIEKYPDDEVELKKSRLSKLIDMISASQTRIEEIEKVIKEANSIMNNDNTNNAENSS